MLRLRQGVITGNGKGRGQGRLAAEGLVTQLVAAWCVGLTVRRVSSAADGCPAFNTSMNHMFCSGPSYCSMCVQIWSN